MKNNKDVQKLLDECLAYRKYGQKISPLHVENMIKMAFKAGLAEKE